MNPRHLISQPRLSLRMLSELHKRTYSRDFSGEASSFFLFSSPFLALILGLNLFDGSLLEDCKELIRVRL